MKVVLVNTSERTGGAAIAAGRLMASLQKAGVDVSMVVMNKVSDKATVYKIEKGLGGSLRKKWNFYWERFVIFCHNTFTRKDLFKVSIANTGFDISGHPAIREADVIHLHWINQGFLSLKAIRKLMDTGKPIIWTLHDLWPATGICHYPDGCDKYKTSCYGCPYLHAGKKEADLSTTVFRTKKESGLSSVTFVGCSRWIIRQAQQSELLKNARLVSIPNPIDTGQFYPVSKQAAREYFDLSPGIPLLLFIADNIHDPRKGMTYLIDTCRIIKERMTQVEVLLMGKANEVLYTIFDVPVTILGYLTSPEDIRRAYSAADVFVIPSVEDNLPNTVMEAMACGTPCCGFDTGGIPEMIDHKKNGYIARKGDVNDLAAGICYLFEEAKKDAGSFPGEAIKKVRTCYAEQVVSQQYMNLYNQLIE